MHHACHMHVKALTWKAPMRRSMGSPRLTKREQRCSDFLMTANSSEAERSTFVCAASSMGFQLSSLMSVSRVSRSPFSSASMYTLQRSHEASVLQQGTLPATGHACGAAISGGIF